MHIHTALTDRALARLGNNHVLGHVTPTMDKSEMQLVYMLLDIHQMGYI
jgi:hypothetical protein